MTKGRLGTLRRMASWSVELSKNAFVRLKVSSTVRTRAELEMVHGRVDELLATLQARPGAVCAVRERIFSELYDELIREVNGNTCGILKPRYHSSSKWCYCSK